MRFRSWPIVRCCCGMGMPTTSYRPVKRFACNLTCLWGAGVRHRITPAALESTVEFFRQHL